MCVPQRVQICSVVLLGMILGVRCGGTNHNGIAGQVHFGHALFYVNVAGLTVHGDTPDRIEIDIENASFYEFKRRHRAQQEFFARMRVPAGHRRFTVRAFTAKGELVAEDEQQATVPMDGTVEAHMRLGPAARGYSRRGRMPLIKTLAAMRNEVTEGETVRLWAEVNGLDDEVADDWSQSCETGDGHFTARHFLAPLWKATRAGTCTIEVIIKTSDGRTSHQSIQLTINRATSEFADRWQR